MSDSFNLFLLPHFSNGRYTKDFREFLPYTFKLCTSG